MSQARILLAVLAITTIAVASQEDALSSAVVPTPPVLTPPAPTPEPCSCCDLCNIVPGPFLAVPGGGSSSSAPILPPPPSPPAPVPAPVNCVTASSGLAPCGTFLTGGAGPPPTPQSSCCNGLAAFLSSARAAAPVAGRQRLRCLCPIIHGDVNAVLPEPVDPVRMLYLPVACGLALPPQTIPICFGERMPTIANLTSAGVLH
ncbi:non-specific lipid transfer protein GPI-anchored 2-like [Miscanthus floridulus]|uniref:non-specific lipid transfer protein GPI-anchored 2-like n=1 Tax=Miscanthus floridulus TaxID=154761 RepID=UPI00345B41F2